MADNQVKQPAGDIPAFFIELVNRFRSKSGKFNQVINWIAGACAIITGLPAFLESYNIQLPAEMDALKSKTVAIAALVGWFVSRLSVQRAVVVNVDGNGLPAGTVAGATHEQLPFTAKKEDKAVEKATQ
jgi:hypothetical protein